MEPELDPMNPSGPETVLSSSNRVADAAEPRPVGRIGLRDQATALGGMLLILAAWFAPALWDAARGRPWRHLDRLERREATHAIDLNSASVDELRTLPGIGPALASRIVDERERRGPFATSDELQRVSGIGPRTVERLRPWVRTDPFDERRR